MKIKHNINYENGKAQVSYEKEYQFGGINIRFVRVTHSIPDTNHIIIKTPAGVIYHGSDYKFDLTPPYGPTADFFEIARAGRDGVLCLLSDCLGSEEEGLTLSESIVGQTFEDEMRRTKGKFIMTTFSSNISRIRQCVEAAVKFNRKTFFLGRSMKENTEIAKKIGYLPIPYSLVGEEKEISRLPTNKVCIIAAGSQGQKDSALSKLALKQNPHAKIATGDKVIFSSDPIPGNEDEVYDLIEKLIVQGADVVYSDIHEELHASGHGNREDLKLLIRLTNPKYFIPIGGMIRHQRQYQIIGENLGYRKESVIMLNEGETVLIENNILKRGEKVKTKDIFIKSNE
jgi:ribonuclease J